MVKFHFFLSKSLMEQLLGSTTLVTRSMVLHPRHPDGFVHMTLVLH
jgi:hypothetical protein